MQAHILVTGFVQGVGYRKFVRHLAREYGLRGWVRNNSDGSVEAVVVGDKMHIEDLIEQCKKGPMLSQVDNLHIEWEETDGDFGEFEIRRG